MAVSNVEARPANIDDAQIELTSDMCFSLRYFVEHHKPRKALEWSEKMVKRPVEFGVALCIR